MSVEDRLWLIREEVEQIKFNSAIEVITARTAIKMIDINNKLLVIAERELKALEFEFY